jgi:hypothetical protein
MYVPLGTRPHTSYAVGIFSRFASKPQEQHWRAVKRIIRYLRSMKNFGVFF